MDGLTGKNLKVNIRLANKSIRRKIAMKSKKVVVTRAGCLRE